MKLTLARLDHSRNMVSANQRVNYHRGAMVGATYAPSNWPLVDWTPRHLLTLEEMVALEDISSSGRSDISDSSIFH